MRYEEGLDELIEDVIREANKEDVYAGMAEHRRSEQVINARHSKEWSRIGQACPCITETESGDRKCTVMRQGTELLEMLEHPWLNDELEERFLRSCRTTAAIRYCRFSIWKDVIHHPVRSKSELLHKIGMYTAAFVPQAFAPTYATVKYLKARQFQEFRVTMSYLRQLYLNQIGEFLRENTVVAELHLADAGIWKGIATKY